MDQDHGLKPGSWGECGWVGQWHLDSSRNLREDQGSRTRTEPEPWLSGVEGDSSPSTREPRVGREKTEEPTGRAEQIGKLEATGT